MQIDAEGSDALVLLGSLRTLAAGRVSALSFEYNSRGHWKAANLEDTVDLLDHLSFDCYWTSNSGQLWRITGYVAMHSAAGRAALVCAHCAVFVTLFQVLAATVQPAHVVQPCVRAPGPPSRRNLGSPRQGVRNSVN